MASISYDGQSLIIDGRRVWLVSGTMHYARVPRADWRDRVRAARQAGLNCLEVVVCCQRPLPSIERVFCSETKLVCATWSDSIEG